MKTSLYAASLFLVGTVFLTSESLYALESAANDRGGCPILYGCDDWEDPNNVAGQSVTWSEEENNPSTGDYNANLPPTTPVTMPEHDGDKDCDYALWLYDTAVQSVNEFTAAGDAEQRDAHLTLLSQRSADAIQACNRVSKT
jgi:hypothetical protein